MTKSLAENQVKLIMKLLIIIAIATINVSCGYQNQDTFKPKVVYKSDDLVITQLSENSFEHTSFLQTEDFGNVPCNGLIVRNSNEVIVFDTPTNDTCSNELIRWINDVLHCRINAIVPTHFHNDCLGGLNAFHKNGIPSYAYFKTIELAKENNFVIPQHGFKDPLTLKIGNETVTAQFFGEGHTQDNIVGYFPAENVMFGGCLVKELNAEKGYLGDANIAAWPKTVENVKAAYPNAEIIVPGHGAYGNTALLDYTISLFRKE